MLREKLAVMRQTGNGSFTVLLCPRHHARWRAQLERSSRYRRAVSWLDDILGYLRVQKTEGPEEETCYLCRFAGQGRRTE